MYQFGLDPIFANDPTPLGALNAGKTASADIPAVTAMTEWIDGAAHNDWFGGRFLNKGWSNVSSPLGSGDAVMAFIWDAWFYTDLESGQKYGLDDFALMPIS